MPPKRSSRIRTRPTRNKTATKDPNGESSSEDTDPSKPKDMVTRMSKKCMQKENKHIRKGHFEVDADVSFRRESLDCYEADWEFTGTESASQSEREGACVPPHHDVEMKICERLNNSSSESDATDSGRRGPRRRQKPRKQTRAAAQKTTVGGVLSPSRRHVTSNTPQQEVSTLRDSVDPNPTGTQKHQHTSSRPRRAVTQPTRNTPPTQHALTKKEVYNSTISPPMVGLKPLNASDTSTPSVDARGSATCSFMDDSAFGFRALEDLPSVPPIELVVSPVKEVSPLVDVRSRREKTTKVTPSSTVTDVSRMSPSKLSTSLELKLSMTPSPERKRQTRQSARSRKPSQASTTISPVLSQQGTVVSSSPQTTTSHTPQEPSTGLFKQPTAGTKDQTFEKSAKKSVTSPASLATSPESSMSSSLVSPQKRKTAPGMHDKPIEPEHEKKAKKPKVHKKSKKEMEAWAAHMNAKFNEIESFELEFE